MSLTRLPVYLLYVYCLYMLEPRDSKVEGSSPPTASSGHCRQEKLVKQNLRSSEKLRWKFFIEKEEGGYY